MANKYGIVEGVQDLKKLIWIWINEKTRYADTNEQIMKFRW